MSTSSTGCIPQATSSGYKLDDEITCCRLAAGEKLAMEAAVADLGCLVSLEEGGRTGAERAASSIHGQLARVK
eukprot:CAMPEP_0181203740 /NCGR_PEP_ID=MMETSP1096-20121128/19555_1 /TAXON_ID=156174 ORGANISM="Chrysochromulina ericina, Strain CCMP281" /NCGR_SAMPLE_ID=MMETSP1096 /ASSEMBLY_ACC=CAM_ASM_000453 /LENGTH=72 /DNA_ID=CAMNT_0023294377 /DNA_START=629 /DNA_END=847 /DNA_ORIENTATION=-